jgi:DNA mismatch repair ATPase MutS
LVISDVSAAQAIKELSKITDRASVRSNPIVYFVLNTLLLWDFECAFLFEDWKRKYAPQCEKWFLALGELESLSCFATLRNVCDHTCYPRMLACRGVEAEALGHPLIPNTVRVTNPLRLQNNILIISGSNMSGKTTYLRTAGINLVLARAGGPVCAKDMVFSDLHIFTSMRVTDDLNDGISTFYAELKRIKKILDAAKSNRNTVFLIDEIFRGTNSVDRLSGARTVITKLSQIGVSGMITTHDLELCDLQEDVPEIQNYSFSEYYENGHIFYDYKMRPGKSKTTNAKYLMELLEIL